jgi:molybdate transport system regulatory protein
VAARTHLSIRIDLSTGVRIGPGKIALLEAIRSVGSISGAGRRMQMSYRKAWLLVDEINCALRAPAVATATGGGKGGGAALTPTGEQLVRLYHAIESEIHGATRREFRAIEILIRKYPVARRRRTDSPS